MTDTFSSGSSASSGSSGPDLTLHPDQPGTGARVRVVCVGADAAGQRLDRWFHAHAPGLGHGGLEKLLRTGQVRVDGGRVKASHRLEAGQKIRIPPLPESATRAHDRTTTPRPPAPVSAQDAAALHERILYCDPDVLVIDKPAGLAVQGGTGTHHHLDAMLDALRLDAAERPRLVHRLDKDTSGVLVLARTAAAARALTAAFRSRETRKLYWAITVGVPVPLSGAIDLPLARHSGPAGERMASDAEAGLPALTHYRVNAHAGKRVAFVSLMPVTGRTHQLRVHMAAIGTPILGDGKYGGAAAFLPAAELPRQLHLHARRLILPHPRRGRLDVTAPPPDSLRATLRAFDFALEGADAL